MYKYKCEYFMIEELVPPEVMSLPSECLWDLFDVNLLIALDRLSITIGNKVTINDWHIGGANKWSGYRTNSYKNGSKKCVHNLGLAVDIIVKGMTPEKVLSFIESRSDEFPEIKYIENRITHLHIDTKG